MTKEKLAFNKEYVEKTSVNKGVKLNNKASRFSKIEEKKEDFEVRAKQMMSDKEETNKEVINLIKKFFSYIKDQTISDNKSPLQLDIERETKNKLTNLVIKINNDENEEYDGMGSTALISVLLKADLIQRDIINNQGFKINLLSKDIEFLKKEIIELKKSNK